MPTQEDLPLSAIDVYSIPQEWLDEAADAELDEAKKEARKALEKTLEKTEK